jgi:hypothetical protein
MSLVWLRQELALAILYALGPFSGRFRFLQRYQAIRPVVCPTSSSRLLVISESHSDLENTFTWAWRGLLIRHWPDVRPKLNIAPYFFSGASGSVSISVVPFPLMFSRVPGFFFVLCLVFTTVVISCSPY